MDQELNSLRALILSMGNAVERSVEAATQGLIERNADRLDCIRDIEKTVNQYHLEVDEKCLQIIASQSPVAAELRMILAILKINTDLERMGDQAVSISYSVRDYLQKGALKEADRITEMARSVRKMITDSLEAFTQNDVKLSENVLLQDDAVDEGKNEMFRNLVALMKVEPKSVEAAIDLLLVSRNLERLGDHATNIAEDVIFASTGKDIRHGGFMPSES